MEVATDMNGMNRELANIDSVSSERIPLTIAFDEMTIKTD